MAQPSSRTAPPTATLFPKPGHNHAVCVSATLARAEAAFASRGLKFTALRRCVLNEIAASHHAVGAYDIVGSLQTRGTHHSPISVYRALAALVTAGVIHRLESRNAYFACRAPHRATADNIVFVCIDCGTIAESEAGAIFSAIEDLARTHGFAATARIAEVKGHCANCRDGGCA